ncbi:ATP-binding protein [Comamonas sp. Y6]|uniref:ATP-binding protein n=1 Tax=Comamonas resistens TaxID=3046670 RepID=A0ABY8SRQ7_9BURK|nr:ATP-binding protein [Comamonas resistens]MDL5037324.1 ATP-binding protein [Comamonas resistens]WHS65460.1 ATP-binding protein [Comamonas resistens]
MKIKNFNVENLNGKIGLINANFNNDINIITGRNGSGKTTFLKLLWFVVSGNIAQALDEVLFKKLYLETDLYSIKIELTSSRGVKTMCLTTDDNSIEFKKRELSENSVQRNLNDDLFFGDDHEEWLDQEELDSVMNNVSAFLRDTGSSIFFPTFRRIEGGFSMKASSIFGSGLRRKSSSDIEEAMVALSEKFSRKDHKFVASLSTQDIVQLLLRQYTNLNDKASSYQNNKSQEIIEHIKKYESGDDELIGPVSERALLIDIRKRIEEIEDKRTEIMRPMDAVQKIVSKIFSNTGIKIGGRLNFGDAANAINSDQMSAGEKQLLSFICYNAFLNNSVFVIDEPELSLHVDWQRIFFKILTEQNPSNQFLVATHSPFVYNKYPEKEVAVDSDRGDNGE